MKQFKQQFFLDALFFSNYRKMQGPFATVVLKANIKDIIIFLLTKSGRFSLLLRFSLSFKHVFIGKISMWLLNYIYSSDIALKANFGEEIYFPHPFGLVIGGDALVGSKCVIFNDITFGKKYPGIKDGMPHIGSKVIIGAGVRILGNIQIGSSVVIGTNTVVLTNIPANSTFVGSKIKSSVYWSDENLSNENSID